MSTLLQHWAMCLTKVTTHQFLMKKNGIPEYQIWTVQFLPPCISQISTEDGPLTALNHMLSKWSAASNWRIQSNLEMESIPRDINLYKTAKLSKILNNEQISFQTNVLCSHPVQTATIFCSETARHPQIRTFTEPSLQLVCEALQAAGEGKQSCSSSPTSQFSQFSAEMCLCGCMTEEKRYQMPATCKTRPQPQLLNASSLSLPSLSGKLWTCSLEKENWHICVLKKPNY